MRIGVNTLFMVPGDVGGTEVYLRNTLVAIAETVPEHTLVLFTNYENDVLLRNDLASHSLVEFHKVHCHAANRPARILSEQVLLPFSVKKQGVDVLWSPGYTAPAYCHVPQAVTICDLQYKSFPEDMSPLECKTLDILVQTACKRCQAIITISEFSRQEVIRFGFAGAEKVHAVPLGVRDDFADSGADATVTGGDDPVLNRLGVQKPYILCVAHAYPHKHIEKLVSAYALLEEQVSHQLVLVGKARRGEGAIQESLAGLRDAGRVVRFSGLSAGDLQTLYRQADIFVLPSAYEGFGLPVVEAMMAGVPVVTTRMASLPEVGGDCALYVDAPDPQLLADQILNVQAFSRAERRAWVIRARRRAHSFTWAKTAEQTVAVLQAIAGES
jgi:glycosyltransferase involved in cell wall biosynthesis